MIHLDNVHFRYPSGEFRLEVPELSVAAGEKVAVIGPSGSGKTTLLNLVAGILKPTAGRLEVDGTDLAKLSDQRRRDFRIASIGFIFQDFGLIDYLDVLDNIVHPCRISSALTLTGDVKERARELAVQLGVSSRMKHHPAELSHGERQRVAICRALLLGPRLILADEATGNLDPRNKMLILDALFQAVTTQQATVLAVTHDHELLDRFDRVIDFRDFWAVSEEAS
jgi:putative ABC transport system ATP-binding protein